MEDKNRGVLFAHFCDVEFFYFGGLATPHYVNQRSRKRLAPVCYSGCKEGLCFCVFRKHFHETRIVNRSAQGFASTRQASTKGPANCELLESQTSSIYFRFDPQASFVATERQQHCQKPCPPALPLVRPMLLALLSRAFATPLVLARFKAGFGWPALRLMLSLATSSSPSSTLLHCSVAAKGPWCTALSITGATRRCFPLRFIHSSKIHSW